MMLYLGGQTVKMTVSASLYAENRTKGRASHAVRLQKRVQGVLSAQR